MRAVIQVVKYARLTADGKPYSKIDKGFLVLLGIKNTDTQKEADYVANKILKLRVFADQNDKLNLSLKDIDGQIMCVSNFTLYGNTKGTNRPDFITAGKPYMVSLLQKEIPTKTGVFGSDMQIESCADGPCTIIIDTDNV